MYGWWLVLGKFLTQLPTFSAENIESGGCLYLFYFFFFFFLTLKPPFSYPSFYSTFTNTHTLCLQRRYKFYFSRALSLSLFRVFFFDLWLGRIRIQEHWVEESIRDIFGIQNIPMIRKKYYTMFFFFFYLFSCVNNTLALFSLLWGIGTRIILNRLTQVCWNMTWQLQTNVYISQFVTRVFYFDFLFVSYIFFFPKKEDTKFIDILFAIHLIINYLHLRLNIRKIFFIWSFKYE